MDSPSQSSEVLQVPQSDRLRLLIRGQFGSEIKRTLDEKGITSILLSQRHGWQRQSLAFLHDCPRVSELIISDDGIDDLSAVSALSGLERIVLECPKARVGPDFATLPRLTDARVDWRDCFASLLTSPTIEVLLIDGFSESDLSMLKLPALTDLRLFRAPRLRTLGGVSRLPRLRDATLVQCPKLQTVFDLKGTSLKSLLIEACTRVVDLDSIFGIRTLSSIAIERCADVRTIEGVSKLPLKKLRLVDINIVDGDMSELLTMEKTELFFTNRSHYSHKMLYSRSLGRFEIVANR